MYSKKRNKKILSGAPKLPDDMIEDIKQCFNFYDQEKKKSIPKK